MKYPTLIAGMAKASRNPLTGDWLIDGQKDRYLPYIMESEQMAARMVLTIDHYNKTGEKKAFKKAYIRWRSGKTVDEGVGEVFSQPFI